MEGWTDGSSVGLGCIYGDVTDRDVTEVGWVQGVESPCRWRQILFAMNLVRPVGW